MQDNKPQPASKQDPKDTPRVQTMDEQIKETVYWLRQRYGVAAKRKKTTQ